MLHVRLNFSFLHSTVMSVVLYKNDNFTITFCRIFLKINFTKKKYIYVLIGTTLLYHLFLIGDVPSMNKFQQMEEHTKKDLDSLRFAFKRGDPVPKFHYEVRSFSKVVLCSDLTDNELEFTVVQGINLNVAKDAHTYCRFVLHLQFRIDFTRICIYVHCSPALFEFLPVA